MFCLHLPFFSICLAVRYSFTLIPLFLSSLELIEYFQLFHFNSSIEFLAVRMCDIHVCVYVCVFQRIHRRLYSVSESGIQRRCGEDGLSLLHYVWGFRVGKTVTRDELASWGLSHLKAFSLTCLVNDGCCLCPHLPVGQKLLYLAFPRCLFTQSSLSFLIV